MQTTHTISVNSPWFEYLKAGTKTFEGRRYSVRYTVGDKLLVRHHTDTTQEPFVLTITSVNKFPSFEDALRVLPLCRVLPGVETVEDGIEVYKKFVSLKTQATDGIVMLGVGQLKTPPKFVVLWHNSLRRGVNGPYASYQDAELMAKLMLIEDDLSYSRRGPPYSIQILDDRIDELGRYIDQVLPIVPDPSPPKEVIPQKRKITHFFEPVKRLKI
jgi:ASC-1-like (ASCH) protein